MRPKEREQALEAIRRLVDREGYEVLRLTISSTRNVILTLDADPGPITIADCTHMNRKVRRVLEDEGLPVDDYAVEVESPGVKRALVTLRHFERFVGEDAWVKLVEPVPDGTEVIRGRIAEVRDGRVTVAPRMGPPFRLVREQIAHARLDPGY